MNPHSAAILIETPSNLLSDHGHFRHPLFICRDARDLVTVSLTSEISLGLPQWKTLECLPLLFYSNQFETRN